MGGAEEGWGPDSGGEVYVVGRCWGTSPPGLRGRQNGGGKRWATWSDVRGPKAVLRRTCGRGWGWEALLLLYICVEKIYHKGKGLTSSYEVH